LPFGLLSTGFRSVFNDQRNNKHNRGKGKDVASEKMKGTIPVEQAIEYPSEYAKDGTEDASDNASKGAEYCSYYAHYNSQHASENSNAQRKYKNADESDEDGADCFGYHKPAGFDTAYQSLFQIDKTLFLA
jgi:hypothetical protein